MIAGQTNVSSSRFGAGAIDGIGRELGRFIVTTMELPWRLAAPRLGASPVAVLHVENMELETLERQVAAAPDGDTVLAIGGGQAIDLGKYLAWKRGLRLVTVPTILSVDAFVTPAAGIRRGHRVEYVGQTSPDPLVIDYDLIRTAPAELNIAGVGDLLSIHTACFDWELAERAGRSEFPFSAADVAQAREILADTIHHADAIRAGTDDGLRDRGRLHARQHDLSAGGTLPGGRGQRALPVLRIRGAAGASIHPRVDRRPGRASVEPPAGEPSRGDGGVHGHGRSAVSSGGSGVAP